MDSAHPAGDLIQGVFDTEEAYYICQCSADVHYRYAYNATTCREMWQPNSAEYECVAQSCEQGYYLDEDGNCSEQNEAEGELCPIYSCWLDTSFSTLNSENIRDLQLFYQHVDTTSCKWRKYSDDRYSCSPDKLTNSNWELRLNTDREAFVVEKGNCALDICVYYDMQKDERSATKCEYIWSDYNDKFFCTPVACKNGYHIGKDKEGDNTCLKD